VAGRVAARQFAVDDWLVCVAMLMSVAETVISFFCTSDHPRRRLWRYANTSHSHQDQLHRHPSKSGAAP
jgi:hypothetical protein